MWCWISREVCDSPRPRSAQKSELVCAGLLREGEALMRELIMCPGPWTEESGTWPWTEGHRESCGGWSRPGSVQNHYAFSQRLPLMALNLSHDDHLGSLSILALECLNCYNKTSPTREDYKNRNLLLTVLEVRSPRSRLQHDSCLGRAAFLIHDWCLLPCPQVMGRVMELSRSLL